MQQRPRVHGLLRSRFAAGLLVVATAFSLFSAPAAMAQDEGQAGGSIFLPLVQTASSGPDNTSPVDTTVISDSASMEDQSAALTYWTREKLAEAPALAIPVQIGPAKKDDAVVASADTWGPATYTAPKGAAPGADKVARAAFAADWTAMAAADAEMMEADAAEEAVDQPAGVNEVLGTPAVYTSYIANWLASMQTIYPHRWIGRFSFTTPGGTSYCSATAISGNNIVTAAHCVYDTPSRNQFYTNKVFAPAYRNGNTPYGVFATTSCTILTAWSNLSGGYSINGWAPYDVAVCTVGTNAAGQTLNQAVGSAGQAWNYGYTRHVFNLGYPWQDYTGSWLTLGQGAYLRLCSAETFQQASDVRGMGCNWGGGISGGPWFDNSTVNSLTYGTNGYWPGRVSGYVTGVNSGIFTNAQNIYAGRFTSNNIIPLCNVRGC